jgi:hypothetical protein
MLARNKSIMALALFRRNTADYCAATGLISTSGMFGIESRFQRSVLRNILFTRALPWAEMTCALGAKRRCPRFATANCPGGLAVTAAPLGAKWVFLCSPTRRFAGNEPIKRA